MLLCAAKWSRGGAAGHSGKSRTIAALALFALLGAGTLRAQQDSAAARAVTPASATIQPGDRIVLKVWREKTMSDTAAVDQNSEVVLPELGVFSVASLTVGSLPDSLRARFSQYLRNPSIDVTVLRRIGVLGEVKTPSLYWVDVTMSLPDVVALAGGVTEIGNPHDVRIVRNGNETKVRDWERLGTVGSQLLSGDQIVVARTSWLSRNMLSVVSAVGVLASIAFTLFRI